MVFCKNIALAFVFWNFFHTALAAPAQNSTVLYVDEEAGFLLLDQVPSAVRDGDAVCVFRNDQVKPNCAANLRMVTKKPLLFPGGDLSRWEKGMEVELRKVVVQDKSESGYSDVTTVTKGLLDQAERSKREELTKKTQDSDKLPKGSPPSLTIAAPVIEGDEFPEIFVPKVRRVKKRSDRDMSETASTVKALKRALKDKGSPTYQFLAKEMPPPEADVVVREDYANPLSGALEIMGFQTFPLASMATYQSLRFRTITNDSINRSTLWDPAATRLDASLGGGVNLQLSNRQSRFVNFGWRYHTYNALNSKATFDEFDTNLIAESNSRVSEQIVHAEFGWIHNWNDWLRTSYSTGLDVAYTELSFDSSVNNINDQSQSILAYARHDFMTLAPRFHLQNTVYRYGFGLTLGAVLVVPAFDFKDSFKGQVQVPERVAFQGNAQDDLEKSLAQKRNPVGFEFYIGLSYQPQRN